MVLTDEEISAWAKESLVSPLTRWGINSPANSESPLKWTVRFNIESS